MPAHILLVEDDTVTRQVIGNLLEDEGYAVTSAPNGKVAIELLSEHAFDVVVSDIRMREIDGVEVLNVARSLHNPPEVILLTGYGSLESAVAALRSGAFNYLLKPCNSAELLECVQKAARRRLSEQRRLQAMRLLAQEFQTSDEITPPEPPPVAKAAAEPGRYLQIGNLRLDHFRHTVSLGATPLHMTPIEYTFLRCLAETPGRVYPCAEIVRHTHGYEAEEAEAQVLLRAHVRNLRRKLPPDYLVTVRSAGYMLVDPAEAQRGDKMQRATAKS